MKKAHFIHDYKSVIVIVIVILRLILKFQFIKYAFIVYAPASDNLHYCICLVLHCLSRDSEFAL